MLDGRDSGVLARISSGTGDSAVNCLTLGVGVVGKLATNGGSGEGGLGVASFSSMPTISCEPFGTGGCS